MSRGYRPTRNGLDIQNPPSDFTAITTLDERSAVYLEKPQERRVPLDLRETPRVRLAHLEGVVAALAAEVEALKKRLDEKEGDHK